MTEIESTGSSHKLPERHIDPRNIWPLALNLLSCFLFMMNSYIVEPSSAYYAHALGSSDAVSGVIIGAAPWFAFGSAFLYSYWTNVTYKNPILMAGLFMITGNLLYANAYAFQSMTMCLVGRSLTGLGAPRVINRRYVADATPFALRTAANAAFAMVTALGSALGPGMAILLNLLDFQFRLPLLGTQIVNGMTAPGYFMALAWFFYTVTIWFTFQEPNRTGLEELREREAQNSRGNDEETALVRDLQSDNNSTVGHRRIPIFQSFSCLRRITNMTILCMIIIFIKRAVLESIVASTSVITKNRYMWTIGNVGTMHLFNGIIVIPVSIMAGYLSQFYEDRFLALCLITITLMGLSILVDFSDIFAHSNDSYNEGSIWAVGPIRYMLGSLIAFSGIEACNPFISSLMSKVVPSDMAAGTLNSGLLSTLVGTSGRATGDFLIAIMGMISIRNLLNLLIIPGILMMLICGFLIRRNYNNLAV
jgi:MFS family permease